MKFGMATGSRLSGKGLGKYPQKKKKRGKVIKDNCWPWATSLHGAGGLPGR